MPGGRRRFPRARAVGQAVNERRQVHIDFYLAPLAYRRNPKPASSTARLLAARDADEVVLRREGRSPRAPPRLRGVLELLPQRLGALALRAEA